MNLKNACRIFFFGSYLYYFLSFSVPFDFDNIFIIFFISQKSAN
jgi:hypothetical protein